MIPALRIPLLNRSTILLALVAAVAAAWWAFAPAPPEVVVARQRRPANLELAGGTLYWTTVEDGLVHALREGRDEPLPGTQSFRVGPSYGGQHGSFLAVEQDGTIHWTVLPTSYAPQPNGELLTLSSDGTAAQSRVATVSYASGLAARDGKVFLAADGKLQAFGGAASPLVLSTHQISAVAADERHVYWAEGYPVIGIHAASHDGRGARVLAAGVGAQQIDASDPERLVILDYDSISILPKAGGTAEQRSTARTALSWTNDSYSRLTVSGGDIFVTTMQGSVVRVPLSGGEPATLARRQRSPWGIAADERWVYWAEADAGRIRRVPR